MHKRELHLIINYNKKYTHLTKYESIKTKMQDRNNYKPKAKRKKKMNAKKTKNENENENCKKYINYIYLNTKNQKHV